MESDTLLKSLILLNIRPTVYMVIIDTMHVNFIPDFVRLEIRYQCSLFYFTKSTYITLNIKKFRSTICRRSFYGRNTVAGFVT